MPTQYVADNVRNRCLLTAINDLKPTFSSSVSSDFWETALCEVCLLLIWLLRRMFGLGVDSEVNYAALSHHQLVIVLLNARVSFRLECLHL